MSAYDEIIRTVREQQRLLAPILDFEKLYGHDFSRVAEAEELREQILQAALPELSSSYQKAIESLQPKFNRMRELDSQLTYMVSIEGAHSSLSRLLSRHSRLDGAGI